MSNHDTTTLSLNDFGKEYKKAVLTHLSFSGVRLGQAAYNAAYEVFPDATRALTGTEVDPYNDSEKLQPFLVALAEILSAPEDSDGP